MFDPNMLINLALGDAEDPTLFPFPLWLHIVFAAVAVCFFVFRFLTDKKLFQAIFAVAVPFSLTIWISDNRTWFYFVGLVELALMTAALVSSLFIKDKTPEKSGSAETSEAKE